MDERSPTPAGLTADITHPGWPLTVGQRWIVERVADDGRTMRTDVTVRTGTLTVACGLRARAVHDVVTSDGVLVSDTVRWYAQDAGGNVWHLGEQRVARTTGGISTAGSWEAGVDGAEPNLVLARPPHRSAETPAGTRRTGPSGETRRQRIA